MSGVPLLGDDRGQRPQQPLRRARLRLALGERHRLHRPPAGRFQRTRRHRVGEQPLPQLRRQSRQLLLLAAVEPLVDHLLDAADDRPHQLPWHPLAPRHLGQHLHRQLGRLVHRAVDQVRSLGAGGVDLDDAHLRRGGLRDDQADQLPEHLPRPFHPGRSGLVAAEFLQRRPDQLFDRRQEAGLLVVEVLVEGAARDAGELDQVGDGRRLVALLVDRRDHRREEPFALVFSAVSRGVPRPGRSLRSRREAASPHGVLAVVGEEYPGFRVQLFTTT